MEKEPLRKLVVKIFGEVLGREAPGQSIPELVDATVLLDTGLDSMGFAVLVLELEDALGFDPFSLSPDPFYPKTFGEFVTFYFSNQQ